nr:unnamed protein product [Callosobruchus chinensis]
MAVSTKLPKKIHKTISFQSTAVRLIQ